MLSRYKVFILGVLSLIPSIVSAYSKTDTIVTNLNDKIYITYRVDISDNQITISFDTPRVNASSDVLKKCKNGWKDLKVVIFERKGNYGEAKWNGNISQQPFTVPEGLSFSGSKDGFNILGENSPLYFINRGATNPVIKFPVYLAIYEKRNNRKIVSYGKNSLTITCSVPKSQSRKPKTKRQSSSSENAEESIEIYTSDVEEGDNSAEVNALSTISTIRQMLAMETEYPFSQSLQMTYINLQSMKDRINNPEVIAKINDVIIEYGNKENELRDRQNASSLAAKAEEQALLAQQKKEEEAKQKEAEQKAKEQEEKQQKRTLWMIIGGVILAVLGFVGNALFKHFSDISNQKRVFEMQQSIASQAEHAAKRRGREIIRNKAHQAVNKGRSKMRNKMQGKSASAPKKDTTKRRSI